MIKDKKDDQMKDIDQRKFRDTTLDQQKLDLIVAQKIQKLKTGNPVNYTAWESISVNAKKILAKQPNRKLGKLVRAID